MLILIIILAIIILLYLFSLSGRTKHPGLKALQGVSYAHRGLHAEGRPENSMAAFRAAWDAGYGIELDLHLLADGNLAVFHDSHLKRLTGQEGRIEDLTTEDLSKYFLAETSETIPTFSQVLELYQGKAPLVVELKCVNNNYAQLCETTCNMLDRYDGAYCLESFDPRCILWLKKNRPDLIRGLLVEDFIKAKPPVPWILRFLMTHQILNFLVRPDFVAHKYSERKTLSNFLARKLWKLQGVSWTITTTEDYQTAVEEGYLPIFENFTP